LYFEQGELLLSHVMIGNRQFSWRGEFRRIRVQPLSGSGRGNGWMDAETRALLADSQEERVS